ncbi:MAG: sugar ABC transporter permease [Candidatus Schekmanbacteria bacterium]|nr:sugar ABC transporter permease [Candidatus Schekmanbacteria bacterium]
MAREDADGGLGLLPSTIADLRGRVPELLRVDVLKGTELLASTEPGRAGTRLRRDSADDKAMYDVAKELRESVAADPQAQQAGSIYAAYQVSRLLQAEGAGVVRAAAPALRSAQAEATVFVWLQSSPRSQQSTWFLALIALLTAAVGALLAWRAGRQQAPGTTWRLLLVGGLAAAIASATFVQQIATARGEANQRAQTEAAIETAFGQPRGTMSAAGWDLAVARIAGVDTRLVILFAAVFILTFTAQARVCRRALSSFADTIYRHRAAYAYTAPAMVGMLVLVFSPFAFGIALSFFKKTFATFEFIWFDNFLEILTNFHVTDPRNFYFTLFVTVAWTILNVAFHVTIGLILALILSDPTLRMKKVYRVLLIVPWAVPNYITALIWKGMFHKQFGAVNDALSVFGVEPVGWFQSFTTAFSANVATNTWLGFPFMMVVCLGALQSIPKDLYEAASVDGAGKWLRFRHITAPLLKPALFPAIILGTIWTFNQFNIIYLVSGGAPAGATDILITDAYRWAFERNRYGYAAAYATIIFCILFIYSAVTNRMTGATKGAFE